MNERPERPEATTSQGGFSLTSLALLVTVLAMLLSSVDLDKWQERYPAMAADGGWRLYAWFGVASVAGALIGLVHTFAAGFRWRTFWIAPACGGLAGMLAGFILLAPGSPWRSLLAVAIFLSTAILLRWRSE